jgi:hypothetical protein
MLGAVCCLLSLDITFVWRRGGFTIMHSNGEVLQWNVILSFFSSQLPDSKSSIKYSHDSGWLNLAHHISERLPQIPSLHPHPHPHLPPYTDVDTFLESNQSPNRNNNSQCHKFPENGP